MRGVGLFPAQPPGVDPTLRERIGAVPFQGDGGQRNVELPQLRRGKAQRGRNDRMRHADRQRGRQARCVKNIAKFHKHAFSVAFMNPNADMGRLPAHRPDWAAAGHDPVIVTAEAPA